MTSRKIEIKKMTLAEHQDNNYVTGTMEERIDMVWPLTKEVLSLSIHYDAEQRLQRHAVCFRSRGCELFKDEINDIEELKKLPPSNR